MEGLKVKQGKKTNSEGQDKLLLIVKRFPRKCFLFIGTKYRKKKKPWFEFITARPQRRLDKYLNKRVRE